MKRFLPFIILSLILTGCKADDPSVIARVGHYKLHQNKIDDPGAASLQISAWMEDCLLALEAENRGIQLNEDYSDELENIKRKLLIEYLIAEELSKIKDPSDEALEEYYNEHKNEYQRTELEVEFIYFSGLEPAKLNSIRRSLLRGESPEKIAEAHPGLFFKTETLADPVSMPEPYSEFAAGEVGAVIGPKEIDGRTYVFKITDRYEQGTIFPFGRVKDIIAGRMNESARQSAREKLLNEIKAKYSPSINRERLKAAGIIIGENL